MDGLVRANPNAAKLNGQTTPIDVSSLSHSDLQGLLLGTHQSSQAVNVKREPEDLRKEPKNPRSQKKHSCYCSNAEIFRTGLLCAVFEYMISFSLLRHVDVINHQVLNARAAFF
uniref:Uncharacterized protein n=1 Tax=Anopheles atroparvus TaxID=41427 RepID=A0A182IW64_ANOAO